MSVFTLIHSLRKWTPLESSMALLTHWGRVTHICVGNLPIIGSDNGLSPDRRQAIIWTNAGIRNKFQWNFNQNYNIFIQENAFENVVWKTAAILSRPQCVKLTKRSNWSPRDGCRWPDQENISRWRWVDRIKPGYIVPAWRPCHENIKKHMSMYISAKI